MHASYKGCSTAEESLWQTLKLCQLGEGAAQGRWELNGKLESLEEAAQSSGNSRAARFASLGL